MTAPKCTQDSISCITCTGSRQVRSVYNAASVFHSCNQSLPRNAPRLQGQEITLTIPGGKNNVLFLPAQTIRQSQRHHSCASKPITRAARGAPDFRVLPASPQVLSQVAAPGAETRAQLHRQHAHDCPPPSRDSANRKPPLCRDQ